MRKQGSPADALKVELAADSGGAPGTVLGGGQLAAADVPVDFRWVRVGLTAPLTVSGPLWLVVNRTGGLSATNYYRLRVDETCSYCGWGVVGLERFELGEPLPGGGFDLPAGGRDGDQPADAAVGRRQASRRWVGPSSGERAAFSAIRMAAVCVRWAPNWRSCWPVGRAGYAGWRGSRRNARSSLARSLWQTTRACGWAWMGRCAYWMAARPRPPIRWPVNGRLPRAGCPCFWNGSRGEMGFFNTENTGWNG